MSEQTPIQPVQPEQIQNETQTEEKKGDWSGMIVDSNVTTNQPKVTQTNFYKEKYGESDWVLMFYNQGKSVETWQVKDLLESIDVTARGIRQGKSGKCYADFNDEETWKKVKEHSGESIGELEIIIDDVPPRTEAPNKNFNKNKKKVDGEKKGKYTKTTKKPYQPKEGKEGENKEVKEFKKEGKVFKKKTTKTNRFNNFVSKATDDDWSSVKKGKDAEAVPVLKPLKTQPVKKEEPKKKVVKKVVKQPELNEEEIEEGWEVVKKGASVSNKKKKSNSGKMDGILDRKNAFE